MFSQDEIDTVLNDAQQAVTRLAQDIGTEPEAHEARGTAALTVPASSRAARIARLRVPVLVRVAERRMPLDEVLKMTPGTILEFERSVDSELDLLVNNEKIGSGVAVKVNERFGLRINRIGSAAQRVQTLGPH
ncbi:MAG: FliM/FliN family flagellar motor switch protein [Planctomycetes bacterium]|nr:FliM/FliN family flagellar motor switch protein [Planctomycetota bacterium]